MFAHQRCRAPRRAARGCTHPFKGTVKMIFKEESHEMMNDTHWHIDMLLLHAHAMFMFHVMFMSCDQEDYVEKCARGQEQQQ